MYRIRFHGRGGQGIKTASRVLGTAFFLEGFEVQDAPRYGAERRGAPIFAYVRADRAPIAERGVIRRPTIVIVADETLIPVASAGVLDGVGERTVLVLASTEPPEVWRERLAFPGTILTLPGADDEGDAPDPQLAGVAGAAAAARLVGVVGRERLERAVRDETAYLGPALVETNLAEALRVFDALAPRPEWFERPPEASETADPGWIDLPLEGAPTSAPAIHAGATSVEVRTGLWRTMRPVIDEARCNRCWWVCSSFCPDGAIAVVDGRPVIDLDHCKGCMVCVAVCPTHAIEAVPERDAAAGGARP